MDPLREVSTHHVADLPKEFLKDLVVLAHPGDKFGVPHQYTLGEAHPGGFAERVVLNFQSGDPRKVGWNGGTSLSYLAAVHDFLAKCQEGQFACEENKTAIDGVQLAIASLKARIERRVKEGSFQSHQAEKPVESEKPAPTDAEKPAADAPTA